MHSKFLALALVAGCATVASATTAGAGAHWELAMIEGGSKGLEDGPALPLEGVDVKIIIVPQQQAHPTRRDNDGAPGKEPVPCWVVFHSCSFDAPCAPCSYLIGCGGGRSQGQCKLILDERLADGTSLGDVTYTLTNIQKPGDQDVMPEDHSDGDKECKHCGYDCFFKAMLTKEESKKQLPATSGTIHVSFNPGSDATVPGDIKGQTVTLMNTRGLIKFGLHHYGLVQDPTSDDNLLDAIQDENERGEIGTIGNPLALSGEVEGNGVLTEVVYRLNECKPETFSAWTLSPED